MRCLSNKDHNNETNTGPYTTSHLQASASLCPAFNWEPARTGNMPFTEKAYGGIYSLGPHIIQRWLFHCACITYSFSLTRTRARTRTMTRPLLAQSGTQNWEEFCWLNLELQLDKKCFLLAAWTYKALRGLESPTSVGLISYNAHNIHLDFGSEFIIGSQYFFFVSKKNWDLIFPGHRLLNSNGAARMWWHSF